MSTFKIKIETDMNLVTKVVMQCTSHELGLNPSEAVLHVDSEGQLRISVGERGVEVSLNLYDMQAAVQALVDAERTRKQMEDVRQRRLDREKQPLKGRKRSFEDEDEEDEDN